MHEEELLGLDVNQAEKDMAISKCAGSHQSWAVRKPKLTSHAISSADGVPTFDRDEAANTLCQHWCSVFGTRGADILGDHPDAILSFVQPAPHDLNWTIGLDELRSCWPPNAFSARGIGAKFPFADCQATPGPPRWLWCKLPGIYSQIKRS